MTTLRLLLVFFALTALLRADVTLAPLFSDGCVLQRDKELRVWGQAAPGEAVRVKFNQQEVAAASLPSGHWLAVLRPEPASATPAELIVTGRNTVVVRDVLVGDVWLCSGQSNMAWQVSRAANPQAEIAAANYPLIRQFKIPQTVAAQPARTVGGKWVTCSPATAGDFSAVAYYFARELQAQLQVPIGLINSSWGGTQIESWMSEPALRADPAFDAIVERWNERVEKFPRAQSNYRDQLATWQADSAAARAAGKPFNRSKPRAPEGPDSRWQPAGLYNAMIAPLVPAALRGVIWYQGETNAERHEEYRSLFPAMIRQWRTDFAQGDLPFFFVQLANLNRNADGTGEQWAWQRQAQTAALALPATGMAVTIDIGEADDIHPKNKQEVGRRLALLALRRTHGRDLVDEGPVAGTAVRAGQTVRVAFTSAAGLRSVDESLPGFELAGADGFFHAATARIEGESIILESAAVAEPVAVRYAWHNNPPAPLFNADGLPAAPFRRELGP